MSNRKKSLLELQQMTERDLLILNVQRTEDIDEKVDQHIHEYHPILSKRVSKLEGFRMWFLGAIALGGTVLVALMWWFG